MVGGREEQVMQQPANGELQETGASKFRRKLSYGLAFISNPLSQRKTTPGRLSVRAPSLAVTEPTMSDAVGSNGAMQECDTSLSPTPATRPNVCSDDTPTKITTPANSANHTTRADDVTTPRPLPRSRTLSFIPRPVSLQTLATTSVDMKASINSVMSASTTDPKPNASPSKIPTPSPPLSERRGSSPRQYLSPHTSQQLKHIASAQTFQARSNDTCAASAMRSRTTPKLVNVTNSQQLAGVTASKKSTLKKVAVSPVAAKSALQENVLDSRRITQRRSHMQERPLRRESLAVVGAVPYRRSFGPVASVQGKKPDYATPPVDRKRSSVHSAQHTPVTVKRFQPKMQTITPESDVVHVTGNSSCLQPRLMGPKHPPTPTPSIDFIQPVLPISNTRNDFRRKRLGTPNGLAGVWRSSRALAATNHEVSQLHRSFTFHSLGRKEDPPPLPSIPEQFRSESLAHFTRYQYTSMERSATERQPEDGASDAASSTLTLGDRYNDNKYRFSTDSTPSRRDWFHAPTTECSGTGSVFVARPSRPPPPGTPASQRSQLILDLESHASSGPRSRPWSISDLPVPNNTDDESILQVKDYMPPLYWAGRFQSRFDQWRTEAMLAHLNPNHVRTGTISECNLDQEKLASCYIFGQLRDLCISTQAADSLWEFEYRYRKDHKLLGNPLDFPAISPFRKQDDGTSIHQGVLGRAMRKLTPRKSSLINLRNLLKGKGKSEDGRGGLMSEGDVDSSSGES